MRATMPRAAKSRIGSMDASANANEGTDPNAPCDCPLTIVLMRELGMSSAANDHAAGETNGPHELALHMMDEEARLFPLLRAVADRRAREGFGLEAIKVRQAVDALEKQHGTYRSRYLAEGKVPPKEVLRAHGKIEEELVTMYAAELRAEAKSKASGSHARTGAFDDLSLATTSRRKAWEQLLLLEDHLATAPCEDCMHKHAGTAAALMTEARTLDGGRPDDAKIADQIRALETDFDAKDVGRAVRKIRKSIGHDLGIGERA